MRPILASSCSILPPWWPQLGPGLLHFGPSCWPWGPILGHRGPQGLHLEHFLGNQSRVIGFPHPTTCQSRAIRLGLGPQTSSLLTTSLMMVLAWTIWGPMCCILASYWAHLGTIWFHLWPQLNPILVLSWNIWGLSCLILELSTSTLGAKCLKLRPQIFTSNVEGTNFMPVTSCNGYQTQVGP